MILKNRKIFFLYDLSKKTGNGHFSRCKYFRKIFPKKYRASFINTNQNWLINYKGDIFDYGIIDSYSISLNLEKKLKKLCNKLITIDDFQRKKFASDIVINYSPLAKKKHYNNNYSKLLLGPKFNFIKNSPRANNYKPKKKFNLFFYFGQRNRAKLTNSFLNKIKNKKIIKNLFIYDGKKKKISHNEFLKKMDKSDIIVCSSGVTLQEALSRKKLIFSKFFSKNQKSFFKFYKEKKMIEDLSLFQEIMNSSIEKINNLLVKKKKLFTKFNKEKINYFKYWEIIKNV